MRMRLLTAASYWGGLEEHTVALARTLQSRGHDVAIVELGRDAFARRKAVRDFDVPILRVPRGPHETPDTRLADVSLRSWRRILQSLNADVCVFAKGGIDVGSWRMDAAARLTCRRYVTIEHLAGPMPPRCSRRYLGNRLPGPALWWHWLRVRRQLRARWPHLVLSVSDAVHRAMANDYAVPGGKLRTVQNGIDVTRFHRSAERRNAARHAWGIPDTAVVFGAVARLAGVKALDVAIEGFARLRRQATGSDPWLVLAGEGPERTRLEELAASHGVADRVVFPGFSDRPESVYPGFDVFVLPSQNEGLPLALIEAMASECAPIAMNVGGVGEVLPHAGGSGIGWRVPPGDREAFFQAMQAAAGLERDAVRDVGRRARQHVVEHFDGRVQFATLSEVLERAARDHF